MTWNSDDLDLSAYLARIRQEEEPKPDLETLRALHRAHVAAIPFENLEIMLGRPVLLEVAALQEKLVRSRRGGYCYEQNQLFAAALERIGFTVTGLGARVRAGATATRAVTHTILRVDLDGEPWVCDVGFGGDGLLEPIPLRDSVEVRQGEWKFAIKNEGEGVRVLRTWYPDGWFDLYAFTLERRYPVDYALMNHYTSTHPRSPFTGRTVVQRPGAEERRMLIGNRLTTVRPDGSRDERDISPHELIDILKTRFEIELSASDAAELVRVHSVRG